MAFPTIAVSQGAAETGSDTTVTITLPAVSNGDVLIVVLGIDGAPATITFPASPAWTNVGTGIGQGSVAGVNKYHVVDGTEGWGSGGSIDVTLDVAEAGTAAVIKITAGTLTGNPEGVTAASGSATDPDPAPITPAATDDYTFVAWTAYDLGTVTVSTYPTNYGSNNANYRGSFTGGVGVGVATRDLNTGSGEDPGVFTLSASEQWVSSTIALRGVSAPAGPGGVEVRLPAGVM